MCLCCLYLVCLGSDVCNYFVGLVAFVVLIGFVCIVVVFRFVITYLLCVFGRFNHINLICLTLIR